MFNYDNEILKNNILKLLNDRHISQVALASATDMKQPRLSKLLNNDEGNRFSIEQICKIANFFDVSIEFLLTGKEQESISTTKQVCRALVSLFENYHLEFHDFEREEKVATPVIKYDYYERALPDIEETQKTIKYHSLFFPHTYSNVNPEQNYSEDELQDLFLDYACEGNELYKNIEINNFLNAFIPIHKLHISRQIPEEAYHYTVESLLEGLKK